MNFFYKNFLCFLILLFASSCAQPLAQNQSFPVAEKKIIVDNTGPLQYEEIGYASWYGEGDGFNLRKTANGEIFNTKYLTAAHRSLPLPSTVRVTNLSNQKSVVLKVNDRGPYINDRIIDLSSAAAEVLGMKSQGIAKVKVECISCKVNNTLKAP
jgi:rare lipoprotein A